MHRYHEGFIRSVDFRNEEISFEIELNDWAEGTHGAFTHLTFYGVRNYEVIRQQLQQSLANARRGESIDEIVSISNNGGGTISMYLHRIGELRLETSRFTET